MALTGQAKTDYMREWMRKRRLDPTYKAECNKRSRLWAREHTRRRNGNNHKVGICEVCGYSETIDTHHNGELREEHILCPNCHALITRGLKTLDELFRSKQDELDPVQPKPTIIRQYRPGVQYRPGEQVTYQGKVITVPKTDADGNTIYEE